MIRMLFVGFVLLIGGLGVVLLTNPIKSACWTGGGRYVRVSSKMKVCHEVLRNEWSHPWMCLLCDKRTDSASKMSWPGQHMRGWHSSISKWGYEWMDHFSWGTSYTQKKNPTCKFKPRSLVSTCRQSYWNRSKWNRRCRLLRLGYTSQSWECLLAKAPMI